MNKKELEEVFVAYQESSRNLEEQAMFLTLLLKIYLNESNPIRVSQGIRHMIPELTEFVIFV